MNRRDFCGAEVVGRVDLILPEVWDIQNIFIPHYEIIIIQL